MRRKKRQNETGGPGFEGDMEDGEKKGKYRSEEEITAEGVGEKKILRNETLDLEER